LAGVDVNDSLKPARLTGVARCLQTRRPYPGRSRNVFGTLIIGDEILSGKRQDKHFPKIVELLKPERIGVALSEEFQLHPEQSTDAIVTHHPEASYFNAG